MELLSNNKLPPIRRIRIGYVNQKQDAVIKFLTSSFPHSLNSFAFNWGFDGSYIKFDEHIDCLAKCLANVKYEFTLCGLELNYDSLSKIIKSSKHMQRLIIAYSKIVGDGDLDFGKHHHSNINYLSFSSTGHKNSSDWRTNKDEMI